MRSILAAMASEAALLGAARRGSAARLPWSPAGCGTQPQSRHQGWAGPSARPPHFRPAPPGVAAGQRRRPGRARRRGSRRERGGNANPRGQEREPQRAGMQSPEERNANLRTQAGLGGGSSGRRAQFCPPGVRERLCRAGPLTRHSRPWHKDRGRPGTPTAHPTAFAAGAAAVGSVQSTKNTLHCTAPSSVPSSVPSPAQSGLPWCAASWPGRELPHGLPGHTSPASRSAGCVTPFGVASANTSHPIFHRGFSYFFRWLKPLNTWQFSPTWNSPSNRASESQVLYSPRSHLQSHRDWAGKGFERALEQRYSYIQMKHPSCLLNQTPALPTIRILLSFTI